MEASATGTAANLCSDAAKGIFQEIRRLMRYVIIYKKNVEKFEEKMKMLLAKRESVQKDIEAAERNAEEIKPDVELWCSNVDKVFEDEVKSVKDLQDKAKSKCFIGLCPNIKSRYQLSRKAEEVVAAFNEQLQQGEFNSVSCAAPPPDIVDATPKDFEAFESRAKVFKDIMEALKDCTTNLIGVYGMAGVGKTTLVKEVYRQAKEDKIFGSVTMAFVNQTPDLQKVQDQLAASLGLKLEGQDVVVRAARLRERLKKEKKVLVILDDIWKKLDLNDVGIPFGDENKGCNILLTSRDLNVLRNEMDAQKNFAISVLEDKEAWDLFKKMAGDDAESPELRSTAIEVAKKCAGLPVAIATVARALRNKGLFAWNDALRKLQRPSPTNFKGIPAHVYSAIELSYNHLEREELKQTFLLCGLLGHNAVIRDLLRYTIGLGLFHGVNRVEETRDRLLTVVSELKSSCLLRDSYTNMRVDMHDLICDVALAIAYRDYNVFALKDEDDLEDWPNEETMEKCTMISLRYANISYFPKELNCPQLDLFLLYNEDRSVQLPINFFKETLNLKVLDLTDMQFQSLPSSISLLTSLRTLCLDYCNLGDIAGVGELKNLEILSLFNSDIEMLPKEIGELIKLRLLDLGGCTRLKIIPAGVISSLSRLEELSMGNSFVQWEVERQANQQSNASLAELKLLSRLTTLDVHIPDAKIMPADLFPKKLERYKIFIGKEWDWVGERKHSRTLKLKLNTSVDELDHGFKMFLKKTEDLYLDDMKGVKIALHELMDEEGFQRLKNFHVQNGSEIEYIISDDGAAYKNEFLQLRSLTLHGLPRLISFCFENRKGSNSSCQNELSLFSEKLVFPCLESLRLSSINVERIWHNRFSNISEYGTQNLTSLTIEGCDNLKQLLSSSMARSLTHLECFEIVGCKCLREVIFAEDIEEEDKATISFPQLNSLKIRKLEHLNGFCSENYNIEFPSLRLLEIEQCPQLRGFIHKSTVEDNQHFSPQALFDEKVAFPSLKQLNISWLRNMKMIWHNELSVNSFCKLEKMAVDDCNDLFTIFPFDLLTTFQQLQSLRVSSCGSMEHIFELQRLNVNETHVVATQLRELCVLNLPKLKNVWNEDPRGTLTFQNLNVVVVASCWSLKNVFPASVARVLPQIKDLTVVSCAVEEIVSKAEGWETSVTNFEFDQVSSLMLWNLPKLKCFHPGMHTTKWPMLKKLKTWHCNKLKILDIGCLNLPNMNEDNQLDSPIQPPLFLVEKVVPKLEEVSLASDDIGIICDSKVSEGFFHKIKSLNLLCYHDESAIFPTTFLERFKNLENLVVGCCKFNDLFSYERGAGKGTNALTLLPIRNLKLGGLRSLKHMWMQGSRLDYILPNLETIEVSRCANMISLGLSSTPFQNLITLDVWECGAMINLVTSSAVQSLVQLKNLRIKNCVSMKEIVGNEGYDEATYDIIFNRLECLEIRHLPSLKSFCSGLHTFGFPSLDQVIVSHCPELEIFCKGDLNTPILQRVQVITGKDEKGHWEGNLNITIQRLYTKKVGYEGVESLILSEFSKAIEIWRYNLQTSLDFKNLKFLEVYGCNSLKYICTTSMALDLVQLKMMQVRNCVMMEQIITNDEAEEATTNTIIFPFLESIILESCSNLRSFYLGHDTVEYPSLTQLKVEDCPKMVAFTTSSPREQSIKTIGIAPFFSDKVIFPNLRDLVIIGSGYWTTIWDDKLTFGSFCELTFLKVKNCESLLNIFPFHMMKRLDKLEYLEIVKFESLVEVIGLDHGLNSTESTTMFIFPKIRDLLLHWLPKLKNFYSRLHTTRWPSLKQLEVRGCDNVEILARQHLNFPETFGESQLEIIPSQQPLFWVTKDTFPNVKKLVLEANTKLTHLWEEEYQVGEVFSNLETLEVSKCDKLKNLVPSSMYFKNLTNLQVSNCHGLKNLLTLSTAKSMVVLTEMSITDCQMIEEIIARGSDDLMDGIVFSQLKTLELGCLPSLSSFCSGNYAFGFPSLEELIMRQCPKMEIFTTGGLSTPMLQGIQSAEGEYLGHWEGNLNAIVQQLFTEKVFPSLEDLERSSINIQRIRHKKFLATAASCAQYLTCLTIEGCHNLKCLFSSSMMESFVQLKILNIENCENVEKVILIEELAKEELMSQKLFRKLEFLLLKYLPKLTRFCHGSYLEFPLLRIVRIESCLTLDTFVSDAEGNNSEIACPTLFNEKVAFPCLKELSIIGAGNWRKLWHNESTNSVRIHSANH